MKIILFIFVVFILAQVVVRLWPVDGQLSAFDQIEAELGPANTEVSKIGGFGTVRPFDPARYAAIAGRLKSLPRSRVLVEDTDALVVVTRSRFWGFPDITRLWQRDGQMFVAAHLVIGQADLGVNVARVRGLLGPDQG